jgi:hypothetical protein
MIFCDGSYLFHSLEKGERLDYSKLKECLSDSQKLIRALFYVLRFVTQRKKTSTGGILH